MTENSGHGPAGPATISVAFDHHIADGVYAARFLARFAVLAERAGQADHIWTA